MPHRELIRHFKKERDRLGLSLHDVAKIAGISPFTINRMEKSRSIPRLDIFIKAAKGIGFMVAIIPFPSVLPEKVEVVEPIVEPENNDVDWDTFQEEEQE